MKKAKITIWVCEDDESLWEYQRECLLEHFPKASVKFFLNAGYAAREIGSPEFIIIDVGGMGFLGGGIISTTRANVEGLADLHPGAIFILNSALGCIAEDVYNELKPNIQAVSRWADGCNMNEEICTIVKEYL